MTNYDIADDTKNRVETEFKKQMERDGVKYGTKTYLKRQFDFFKGAMIALNTLPAYWTICLSSGREILDNPKKVKDESKEA